MVDAQDVSVKIGTVMRENPKGCLLSEFSLFDLEPTSALHNDFGGKKNFGERNLIAGNEYADLEQGSKIYCSFNRY